MESLSLALSKFRVSRPEKLEIPESESSKVQPIRATSCPDLSSGRESGFSMLVVNKKSHTVTPSKMGAAFFPDDLKLPPIVQGAKDVAQKVLHSCTFTDELGPKQKKPRTGDFTGKI